MNDPRPSLRDSGLDPADAVAAYLDDVAKRYRVFGESDAMPRLLAAVEAALAEHQPHEYPARVPGQPPYMRCDTCEDGWPCSTYEAISRALLGEGE